MTISPNGIGAAESSIGSRYTGTDYLDKNPTWDLEDSPWKADLVRDALSRADLRPASIAEVGCGAGGILARLREYFPDARLSGFDIAPGASKFWSQHEGKDIDFSMCDFLLTGQSIFDVILLLDVLEHLADPNDFLQKIRLRGQHFVFHFPLDLSALSVARERPLLYVRSKVGHLHYFTKTLALALLAEAGYEVIDWRYTGAAFSAPGRTFKTRMAGVARRIACVFGRDLGVRLLGGETLIVTARPVDSAASYQAC